MPGSGMHIEEASVRGVASFGMLCSALDLGWISEADGVLVELPDNAVVGEACPLTPFKVRQHLAKHGWAAG